MAKKPKTIEEKRRVAVPADALASIETELALLGVLMNEPGLRGELIKKYPGRADTFFSTEDGRVLFRAIMETPGLAVPGALDPKVPELRAGRFAPSKIWDGTTLDDRDRAWDYIESLRQLTKRRTLAKIIKERAKGLLADPLDRVDEFVSGFSADLSRLTADSSSVYEPLVKAVAEQYRQQKAAGTLGHPTSTGIPALDDRLGGGLYVDPGEFVGLAGAEKNRKCVTGDTLIYTERGIIEIGKLFASNPPEWTPYSLTIGGMHGPEKTSHLYYNGFSETVRLTSYNNYAVEGTPNHPLLTISTDGVMVWKPLSQIAVGDFVAIRPGLELFGQSCRLRPSTIESVTECKACGQTTRPHKSRGLCVNCYETLVRRDELDAHTRQRLVTWSNTHINRVTIPAIMTDDLARWLGYIVSEGIANERGVSFSNQNQEVVQDYLRLCESLFGLSPVKYDDDDYRLSSVIIGEWVSQFDIGADSYAKQVPPQIMGGTRSEQANFLKAYFEGDGGITSKPSYCKVHAGSVSGRLIKQLQMMLLNFGVVARTTQRDHAVYPGTVVYELGIVGRFVGIFMDKIGFVSTSKNIAFTTAGKPQRDVLPYQFNRLLAAGARRGAAVALATSNVQPEHISLVKSSGEIQLPDWDVMRQFFWDKVVEVAPGFAETFDVTVPGTQSFIGNGIVNHNTTLLRNWIAAWCRDLKTGTIYICNEESVTAVQIFLDFVAQEATRIALREGLQRRYIDDSGVERQVPMSFTRQIIANDTYKDPDAAAAAHQAFELVENWPLRIYTAGLNEGNAGDYNAVLALARSAVEFQNVKQVACDNMQGWRTGEEDDYAAMTRTVPGVGAFTGVYNCLTVALSQYSRQGLVRGGGGLEGRVNVLLGTKYDEKEAPDRQGFMPLEVVLKAGRTRAYFSIKLKVEPRSGLIVGEWPTI